MRIFETGNWLVGVCPVCKTKKDGPVTLVGIPHGTDRTIPAEQIHVECLDLEIVSAANGARYIVQKLPK